MNSRWLPALLALCLMLPVFGVRADDGGNGQLTEKQKEYIAWAKKFISGLHPQHGKVELPGGMATLQVPDDFYYLPPDDANKVLTEAWGNPGGSKTLGMLFPSDMTPLNKDAWGVVIRYSDDGYVDDKDAKDINYNDLLKKMQEEAKEANKQRVKAGYEAVTLVGWAAQPYYDSVTHKLHWAKDLKFAGEDEDTLNYNIRVLGRKGYLSMNFVASMHQLPEIEQKLDSVLGMASFNDGYRYEQFKPNYDKIAAYGIGGLVAGKLLAKAGFFAVALVLLKKFGVILVAAIGGLLAKFRRKSS